MRKKTTLLRIGMMILIFVSASAAAAGMENSEYTQLQHMDRGDPVFTGLDGGIVVHSPNPAARRGNTEHVSFLVDLNLPEAAIAEGDGYYLWIYPDAYHSSDIPDGAQLGHWTDPSALYEPRARDIERSGWLMYRNEHDQYIHVYRGTVESWTVLIVKWDSQQEKQLEFYRETFDFTVVID